jgi:hypothetical protein
MRVVIQPKTAEAAKTSLKWYHADNASVERLTSAASTDYADFAEIG